MMMMNEVILVGRCGLLIATVARGGQRGGKTKQGCPRRLMMMMMMMIEVKRAHVVSVKAAPIGSIMVELVWMEKLRRIGMGMANMAVVE